MKLDRFGRPLDSMSMSAFPVGPNMVLGGKLVETRLVEVRDGVILKVPTGVRVRENRRGGLAWVVTGHSKKQGGWTTFRGADDAICLAQAVAALQARNEASVRPDSPLPKPAAANHRPVTRGDMEGASRITIKGRTYPGREVATRDGTTYMVPYGINLIGDKHRDRWCVAYRVDLFRKRTYTARPGSANQAAALDLAIDELRRRLVKIDGLREEVTSNGIVPTDREPFGRIGIGFEAGNLNSGILKLRISYLGRRKDLSFALRTTDVLFRSRLREAWAHAVALRDWADECLAAGEYFKVDALALNAIPAEVEDTAGRIEITDAMLDGADEYVRAEIAGYCAKRNLTSKRAKA